MAHRGVGAGRDREPVLEAVGGREVRRTPRLRQTEARASRAGTWRRTARPRRPSRARRRARACPRRAWATGTARVAAGPDRAHERRRPARRRGSDRRPRRGRQAARARAPRACAGCRPRSAGSRSSRAGCGARPRRGLSCQSDATAHRARRRDRRPDARACRGRPLRLPHGAGHGRRRAPLAGRPRHHRRGLAATRTGPPLAAARPHRPHQGRPAGGLRRRRLLAVPGARRRGRHRRRPRSLRALVRRRAAGPHRTATPLRAARIRRGARGLRALDHRSGRRRAARCRLGATARTRARRGRRGRGLAHPHRPGSHGRRLRRDLDPGRGRPRRDDRRGEGVLPGTGIGRSRAEPRSSASAADAPAMRRIGGGGGIRRDRRRGGGRRDHERGGRRPCRDRRAGLDPVAGQVRPPAHGERGSLASLSARRTSPLEPFRVPPGVVCAEACLRPLPSTHAPLL